MVAKQLIARLLTGTDGRKLSSSSSIFLFKAHIAALDNCTFKPKTLSYELPKVDEVLCVEGHQGADETLVLSLCLTDM